MQKTKLNTISLLVITLVVLFFGCKNKSNNEAFPISIDSNIPKLEAVKPHTPLELAGRDIYVREACYNCHSQTIHFSRSKSETNGNDTIADENVKNHSFQWGTKRTAPDLFREGGKRSNLWHFNHIYEHGNVKSDSIKPNYQWIIKNDLDASSIQAKMKDMRILGTKLKDGTEFYTDDYISKAPELLAKQAQKIAQDLIANNVRTASAAYVDAFGNKIVDLSKKEIVALIAYLQRLGTDTTNKVETTRN